MGGLFSQKTKATSSNPAVGALTVQQSSYGVPVPICYGTNRLTGNIIWYGDFKAVKVSTSSGGSGKGGSSSANTSYSWNYYASFAVSLCEGEIDSVGQIWENKGITDVATLGGTTFTGASGQSPWGYLTTYHSDEALSYSGTAYVGFSNYNLGDASSTPALSFEVFATPDATTPSGQDAWPADVIEDFLQRAAWPVAYLDTLAGSDFDDYTRAMGFAISPFFTEQESASEQLLKIMDTLNCEFLWTNGVLKIIPYGDSIVTGNGSTYTPDLTPIYDLTDDDFIAEGSDPSVSIERTALEDLYNQQPIEYRNKNNSYNIETDSNAEDLGDIDMNGVRTATTLNAHHVTDPETAKLMASIYLWRHLFVRRKFKFNLGWKHVLLEPMDYVTLTSELSELSEVLVRIVTIEENEDGMLSLEAEEVPGQLAQPALYLDKTPDRYQPNYYVEPQSINAPVFIEPTLELLQKTNIELWVALSSPDPLWGGCNIYVSTDGVSFQYLDRFEKKSMQGVLTASLSSGSVIDTTNTLSISMAESLGTIESSPTQSDATNLNTLCFVDGELLAFGAATLTGSNAYDLTYLVRGAYGSTISAHDSGANFVRLNEDVFKYVFDQSRINKTMYYKFQSFNIYGLASQDLSSIPSYTYKMTGSALVASLDDVTNVTKSYKGDIAQINWDAITDIRTPILSEIRKGDSASSAQFLGRTSETSFPVYGDGKYWIFSFYQTPFGEYVYSSNPPYIEITNSILSKNVLDSYDEQSTGWTGTLTNMTVVGSNLVTDEGVLSASYEIPSGHIITSNYLCNARVAVNWESAVASPSSDITAVTDITAIPDITFAGDQSYATVVPQISLSEDGGSTWSDWQNWVAGVYTFNAIKIRLLVTINNADYQVVISSFDYSIDVDGLIQTGTSTSSASGPVTVTFTDTFNTTPDVQLTPASGSSGSYTVNLIGVSTSSFSYEVLSSGSLVSINVGWSATGD